VEAANDAQTDNCLGKHSMRKRKQPKNLSKPILWYRNVYNQIASDVWETDNPVHELTTDKPQPVLIRAIFEHLGFTT